MVKPRSIEQRLDGLEKAVAELKVVLNAKFDVLLQEIRRASRANTQQQQDQPHTECDDASSASDGFNSPIGGPYLLALSSFSDEKPMVGDASNMLSSHKPHNVPNMMKHAASIPHTSTPQPPVPATDLPEIFTGVPSYPSLVPAPTKTAHVLFPPSTPARQALHFPSLHVVTVPSRCSLFRQQVLFTPGRILQDCMSSHGIKHEHAPPWLISTPALRTRLFPSGRQLISTNE